MDKDKFEKYLEESKETHPLGRVGRPEEVADLILFLASDKALWMTGNSPPLPSTFTHSAVIGTLVAIDGGRSKVCSAGQALVSTPSISTN